MYLLQIPSKTSSPGCVWNSFCFSVVLGSQCLGQLPWWHFANFAANFERVATAIQTAGNPPITVARCRTFRVTLILAREPVWLMIETKPLNMTELVGLRLWIDCLTCEHRFTRRQPRPFSIIGSSFMAVDFRIHVPQILTDGLLVSWTIWSQSHRALVF